MCLPNTPIAQALQKNDPVMRGLGLTDKLSKASAMLDPLGTQVQKLDPIMKSYRESKLPPKITTSVNWSGQSASAGPDPRAKHPSNKLTISTLK